MKSSSSLAVEATLYWIAVIVVLIVATIIAVQINAAPPSAIGSVPQEAIAMAGWIIIGYFCWMRKRLAFLIASVLAVPVSVLVFVTTLAAPYGAFRIIPHLLVTFYAYRAYRELKIEEA